MTDMRRKMIEPLISMHRGRIVKLMGDGILVEFSSLVDAVQCAMGWHSGADSHVPWPVWRCGIGPGCAGRSLPDLSGVFDRLGKDLLPLQACVRPGTFDRRTACGRALRLSSLLFGPRPLGTRVPSNCRPHGILSGAAVPEGIQYGVDLRLQLARDHRRPEPPSSCAPDRKLRRADECPALDPGTTRPRAPGRIRTCDLRMRRQRSSIFDRWSVGRLRL